MTDLTAIDILVNPDDATIRHAQQYNARMRESVPTGFALDATHQPHITTLQRFVRTADLDNATRPSSRRWPPPTSRRSPTTPSHSDTPTGAFPARDSRSSSSSQARRCSTSRPRCSPQ